MSENKWQKNNTGKRKRIKQGNSKGRGERREKTGKEAGKKTPRKTKTPQIIKKRGKIGNRNKINQKINKEKGQGKKQKIKNRSKNPKINPTKNVGPACSLSTGPAGLPLATVLRLHLSGRQVSGQTHRSIRWRHASHRWPESHLSTRTAVISPEWLVGILYKGPKTLYWASNQAKRDLSS